jgi:hypothetical protein
MVMILDIVNKPNNIQKPDEAKFILVPKFTANV